MDEHEVVSQVLAAVDNAAYRNSATRISTVHLAIGGRRVLEIVAPYDGDTYRAVYTVRFEAAVYVLHAFQKKSPSGIKTARKDVELIGRRLSEARMDYEMRYGKQKK